MAQFRGVELTALQLHSDRLTLRPWQPTDVDEIVTAMRTGALHRFLPLPDPYTESDALDFVTRTGQLERENGTGFDCAVVDSATGRLVGSAALRLPAGLRAADIGYWIAPAAQGVGYATEATTTLARWAFEHGVHRVELRVDVANLASAHVALRAGFGFEGVRRDALPMPAGRRDLAVFVRTADDRGDPIPPRFPPLPVGGLGDGVLTLREMVPQDIDAFAEQEDDPLTREVGFTGLPPARRAMERLLARARLDLLVADVAGFAMVDAATGAFAGSVRLRVTGPPNIGGIGYAVHPAFRGRGFTSRALRLLAAWAFEVAEFARLELGAKVANIASQRAAVSAGFQPDGIWRARLRNADGTFSDEARFSLVNPRYS